MTRTSTPRRRSPPPAPDPGSTPTARTAPTLKAAEPGAPSGAVLAVILSAMFMGQFDFFIVNVAAPTLRHDLNASNGALELIVGGYAFAYAGGLITGGRLGDLFGYRRLFVAGMLGFAVTSLLCGLADTPAELVAARVAQGLTAAAMLPQVLALITASYPPHRRGWAIAWYGAAAGLGSIAGQVLGGLLVSADDGGLGWRLIFLINVPIGAVVALLAMWMLPAPSSRSRPGLDPVGALGVAATLALLLVPLTLGSTSGWPPWTWLCLAAAIPAGVATLAWERGLARRGGTPTLQTALLRVHSLRTGLLAIAAFMLFFASFMFTLTLLLQAGMRLDPFAAGLAFAPTGIAYAVSSLAARPLVARYRLAVPLAGCLLTGSALAVLIVVLACRGTATPVGVVVACTAVLGLGNGAVLPTLTGAALRDVPAARAGVASGMFATAQQFAASAGVALIGTIFFTAAHTRPGPAGRITGMVWSGATDLALVAAVAALVVLLAGGRRGAARERPAVPS